MTKKQIWDYSPAPESTDHIQLKDQYDLFINGEFISAVDGKYFDTINPSNGSGPDRFPSRIQRECTSQISPDITAKDKLECYQKIS